MTKHRKASSAKSASIAKTSNNHKANTLNPNKGTAGQNTTRAKAQGNRGKQLNPNRKG